MTDLILFLVVSFIFGFALYAYLANRRNSSNYVPQPLSYYPEYDLTDFDVELIRLINEYRDSLLLDSLIENEHLSDVSYSHSLYMSNVEKLSHDFSVNRQAEFPNRRIGEIVAYNYHEPQAVLTAWKNSHAHNEVLLNIEYKFIGISFAVDSKGKIYVCALLLN